jgi:hypothetical protein
VLGGTVAVNGKEKRGIETAVSFAKFFLTPLPFHILDGKSDLE